MKINDTSPLPRSPALDQARTSKPATAGQATAASEGAASVSHLNPALADTSQDIDAARVDAIKQAIGEGRLEMHTDRIADALINSLGELAE